MPSPMLNNYYMLSTFLFYYVLCYNYLFMKYCIKMNYFDTPITESLTSPYCIIYTYNIMLVSIKHKLLLQKCLYK